jgi:hypothetical protein
VQTITQQNTLIEIKIIGIDLIISIYTCPNGIKDLGGAG